jgi:putative transcriptional regulator
MIQINLSVVMAKKRMHSLKELHKLTGISRTTLTALYYEKGKGVQFDTLDALCEALDVPVGELIERVS